MNGLQLNLSAFNPLTGHPYSQTYWQLYATRSRLPVWTHKAEFMRMLAGKQCILLEAETGSGKTTQVPQWCLEWLRINFPHKQLMVGCTQPRRLAAVSVANRVAHEMDVELGQEVGYSIRFEEATSYQTVLKYCTDGVLLNEATRFPLLERYGVILLDEVHERTLTTDVLMGLVKELLGKRPDLRVVVMSASLDTGNFNGYFAGCSLLRIAGRSFPVKVEYSDWDAKLDNYYDKAIQKVVDIHMQQRTLQGDILLFLTGQDEIEEAVDVLNSKVFSPDIGQLVSIPLYSVQQHEQQRRILEERTPNRQNGVINRRCIVATNIAETSMTIDGVVFVVDPGFCKRKQFDPKTRIESLVVQRITQASAIQRAGRAGRTCPGHCYRLYTEHTFEKQMRLIDPEIRHSNLENVVLRLMKCGVKNLFLFDFMDAPPKELLQQAITQLTNLEAIDDHGGVTPLGSKMTDLPVDPPLARILIESEKLKCSDEVITICAMLSSSACFNRPRKKREQAEAKKAQFVNEKSDHLTLLRVYEQFLRSEKNDRWCFENFLNYRSLQYADDVRQQLIGVMRRLNLRVIERPTNCAISSSLYSINILKSLVAGSFMKVPYFKQQSVGLRRDARQGHYVTVASQLEGAMQNRRGLVSGAADTNSGEYLFHPSSVSVIRPEWLIELAPRYYSRIPANCEAKMKLVEAQRAIVEQLGVAMDPLTI